MPYIKGTCRAGKTKEYCFYYSSRHHPPKMGRSPWTGSTSEAQKRVNRRQAERQLTRKMNANFSGSDLYVTFHYRKEDRPKDREEMRRQIRRLLDKLRRIYSKAKVKFKYIWVAEIGSRGAAHLHMVMSGIEIGLIKKVWPYGHINIQPLDDTGQYRKLAEYFIKYSDRTMGTDQALQGKRYNCSRNLITPKEKKRVVTSRKEYPDQIKIPAGWYLDKESVRSGIHEFTGYPYFYYTLVQLE